MKRSKREFVGALSRYWFSKVEVTFQLQRNVDAIFGKTDVWDESQSWMLLVLTSAMINVSFIE